MKLCIKFLIIMMSCSVYAEQLTQEKYDALLNQNMQTIQNTKVILDSEQSTATSSEQSKALCDRIMAYERIKEASEQNQHLENASMMLIAANFYLDRQSKSLDNSNFSRSIFCRSK